MAEQVAWICYHRTDHPCFGGLGTTPVRVETQTWFEARRRSAIVLGVEPGVVICRIEELPPEQSDGAKKRKRKKPKKKKKGKK